jgi:hypothetical protein
VARAQVIYGMLRRLFITLVLVAASRSVGLTATTGPAAKVDVPAGDRIAVVLLNDVGSRLGKVGEPFTVRTVSEYFVDGRLVLPQGTPGYGVITQVKRAALGKVNGELAITVKFLVEPGGNDLAVSVPGAMSDAAALKEHNGSVVGHWLLCALLCVGPPKGDDILLKTGTQFHVYTVAESQVPTVVAGTQPATLEAVSPAPSPRS